MGWTVLEAHSSRGFAGSFSRNLFQYGGVNLVPRFSLLPVGTGRREFWERGWVFSPATAILENEKTLVMRLASRGNSAAKQDTQSDPAYIVRACIFLHPR